VLVVTVAAVLGTLTGAVALPDRAVPTGDGPIAAETSSPGSPSSSARQSPSPSATDADASASADATQGPISSADLLTVDDFADVGLTLAPERSDRRVELVGCDKNETLDDVAASGPPVQQFWSAGSVGAIEQAVAGRDEDEAKQANRQVLRRLEACQRRPKGYWLYGPTHTERLEPGTTVSWLGLVNGELNTTGRAPAGERISGAVAVLRNGARVAMLNLSWCQSAGDEAACVVAGDEAVEQLTDLSRAAARRLG